MWCETGASVVERQGGDHRGDEKEEEEVVFEVSEEYWQMRRESEIFRRERKYFCAL
jgi:uncharacterized lipoprotein NlpE involved in copper resistance